MSTQETTTDVDAPAKFRLGRMLATPGAISALTEAGQEPTFFLQKHVLGDWGQCCEEDAAANDAALVYGSRIISVYKTLLGVKLWVITEAETHEGQGDRAATTILLPEEY